MRFSQKQFAHAPFHLPLSHPESFAVNSLLQAPLGGEGRDISQREELIIELLDDSLNPGAHEQC